MKIKVLVLGSLFFLSSISAAQAPRLRVAALSGFGQSLVTDSLTKKEDLQGPIASTFALEYSSNGTFEWGVEHKRTWSVRSGSVVGSTGVTYKYFFWFSLPQSELDSSNAASRGVWEVKAFSPYVGIAGGISQASVIDTTITAVAYYVGVSGGLDWNVSRTWGIRMEGSRSATLSGRGRVDSVTANLGLYFPL